MAFSPETYGALKGYIDKKIGRGAQSLGYVTNGGTLPTTRKDGSALQDGDYVLPHPSSSFPFTIGTVTFANKKTTAFYNTLGWTTSTDALQFTNETPVSDKANESISGSADYQSDVNKEFKAKFADKEDTSNKFNSFDDLPVGDLTQYPSGHAVRELNKKNIPATRKVANYTLENDITVQQIIDAFKDVARTYKNVTFDCDDNILRDIVVSCFKAGEVLSSINTLTTEEYKLATAKAIYDFVRSNVQGAIKIKGKKATYAEIEAISDAQANDEWFCEANSHFYLFTSDSVWMDMGGGVDLTSYIQKSEIVNNLTTNDSQKPLSAAQGKALKDLVDEKQDKIEIVEKGSELVALNPTINFVNRKINSYLGSLVVNIEGSPSSPVVNWTSDRKTILKLPTLARDYSYPSQTRVQISRPSGYWTCEENRHAFYDYDGEYYVNPTIGIGTSWQVKTVSAIGVGSDGIETPVYDKNGNVIHIAEWVKNSQNQVVVEKDGTPYVDKEVVEIREGADPSTPNRKIYTLKYEAGSGYSYINEYYQYNDGTGKVEGTFVELVELPIVFNTNYMYLCHVMNYQKRMLGQNFVVDGQGRLCEYKITESETSKMIGAKLANTVFSDFEGLDGTIVITPIDHSATLDETTATIEPHTAPDPDDPTKTIIDYYEMIIHGANTYTNIVLQKTY